MTLHAKINSAIFHLFRHKDVHTPFSSRTKLSTIHKTRSTIYRVYSMIYIACSRIHKAYSTIYKARSTIHTNYSTIYKAHSTMHKARSMIHNTCSTTYNDLSTMHNACSTIYLLQTSYTIAVNTLAPSQYISHSTSRSPLFTSKITR